MTGALDRLVRVAEIMGTVVSVHAILAAPNSASRVEKRFAEQTEAAFTELRELDHVFSPFRPDSDISRLRDGTLTESAMDARVAEVRAACARAEADTGGRFSAMWRGWFDPTGYVKGWAVEGAFDHHLRQLLDSPEVLAIGVNAGGDMQLATAPETQWEWRVGIAHPTRPGELLATVELRDGAVATSGTAERGTHIVDPRTGEPALAALSATVTAPTLSEADVWATAAVVAGIDNLGWVSTAPRTSGIVHGLGEDRASPRTRRWSAGIELVSVDSRKRHQEYGAVR